MVLRGNAAFFKKLSQIRKQALVKIVGAIFALLVILGVWHHSSSNSKHHKKHHKKVTHTQEVNSKLKLIKYFPTTLDMISLRLYSQKIPLSSFSNLSSIQFPAYGFDIYAWAVTWVKSRQIFIVFRIYFSKQPFIKSENSSATQKISKFSVFVRKLSRTYHFSIRPRIVKILFQNRFGPNNSV